MTKKLFIPFVKKWLFTVLILILSTSVYAQQVTVTGKVTDETNMGLPGVSVLVKGGKKGTTTDFDGNFEISVSASKTLIFSYLGYQAQEMRVGKKSIINIQLQVDTNQLNEVVVIGYGEVKRKDLTGSLGSIEVGEVSKAPVSSLDQAMAGRISGVQVTSSQGRPGSSSSIKIRGTGSLTQSSSPLYVVDGFPIENFDISSIDQSDIASLEILKGPSAVAIYGARGGNGVILITSKSGVNGKAEVSYNSFYGVNRISKRVDVLSPYDFVDLRYEVAPDETANRYGSLDLYLKPDGTSINGISWQDEVFRDTEVLSNTVSVNGGSIDSKYNLSLSNYTSDGLLENSGFDRTYVKLKLDQRVSKKLRAGANVSFTTTNVTGTHTSTNILDPSVTGGSSNARFNLLKDIVQGRPTGGLFYSNEELLGFPEDPDTEEGAPISNPIVNSRTQVRADKKETLLFNGFLDYKVATGLNLRVSGGIQKQNRKLESFDEVNSAYERRNGYTRGKILVRDRTNTLFSSTLTYKKTLNEIHKFKAMVGYDYQEITESMVEASGSDFPEPNLGVDDLGSATEPGFPQSYTSPTNILSSFFYRLNYDLKEKYLFTTTLRYDGSSRFGANNKYGLFPSVSAAWRFSDEDFLTDSKILSEGKLRMEWGQVGNNRIPAFVSKAILNSGSYGESNGVTPGVSPSNLVNPDIQWETQEQINLGVDVGLLNDKLMLTADVYRKESKDLLLRAPTPASSGFSSVYRNIGKIKNEGLELTLSTINLEGELSWNSNINFTFPSSETLGLVESDILYSNSSWSTSNPSQDAYANDFITVVGEPYGLMFGFVDDGLYRADDFDEFGNPYIDVSFGNEELGHRKYVDVNGDKVIDDKDRVVLGNPNPKFFGGFSNNFKYKGFDLNVFLQWSSGNDIYNANRILWTSGLKSHRNFIPEILNRWRDDNTPEQNEAAIFRSINDVSQVLTSQYIEDGSYLRLKTVSLGYTFPEKWISKLKAQRLRVYVTGQNLVTWTKYTGYDPEVSTRGNGLTSGVDFGAYPRSKTLIGGLSVTF